MHACYIKTINETHRIKFKFINFTMCIIYNYKAIDINKRFCEKFI